MADPKVKDWPKDERPRERLIKYGAESLSDAQLLAIILRTGGGGRGVVALSMELLDKFRSLRGIDCVSLADLSGMKGLGTAKIAQLKAAFALGKRLMGESLEGDAASSSSRMVHLHFAPRVKNLKKEVFLSPPRYQEPSDKRSEGV